jgi:hypothetical protein
MCYIVPQVLGIPKLIRYMGLLTHSVYIMEKEKQLQSNKEIIWFWIWTDTKKEINMLKLVSKGSTLAKVMIRIFQCR